MANEKQIKIGLDLNKIPVKNLVIENVTSTTRPTSPVAGQVIFETDTKLMYQHDGTEWKAIGEGGLVFRGTVGGTATGALANLPTTAKLQDAYYVGADGDYGADGATQHAVVGDFFFCSVASTDATAPTWSLVPAGNGTLRSTITLADGTTAYEITNTLHTDTASVSIYDASGVEIMAGVTVTETKITITVDSAVATAEAGTAYTVVAIAG
jgi:hypothetical protein